MKKIISIALVLCMLLALTLPMTGCRKKVNSGTEAAKLLLANEWLDEKLLSSPIDIGLSGSKPQAKSSNKTIAPLSSTARSSVVPLNSTSGGHTWTDFPAMSSSLDEFSQFMKSVEDEVVNVAEDIAFMKEKVGVTDKWVEFGGEKQMLRVYENYECLLVKGIYDDIHVYYRHTDENARNYYEMYSLMSYDDGTTGNIHTLFVPGEWYEYMYENSNGFVDYFIAENSRGYWVNTRFTVQNFSWGEKSADFSTHIIKDGLGYGFFKNYRNYTGEETHEIAWYTVFDPNTGRELFHVVDGDNLYRFEMYFTAIRNGLISVSADELADSVEPGVFETAHLDTITTVNGVYTASNEAKENEFAFETGYIQYIYGEEKYYGSATFATYSTSRSMDEACVAMGEHVDSMGLELYCDMETVALSLEHASLMTANFEESFEWNGYILRDLEQVDAALSVLHKDYDDARSYYESVKEYETVRSRQTLSKNTHFATVNIIANGENRMDGTAIQIGGINVFTDDVALFDNGMKYVLKVGLARVDEAGNPISVNTVALSGSAPTAVTFGGNSITLSASGEYAIPKNLHSGRYAAVVYVATADEGIRVSELQKIAFVDIREGEIESSAMLVEAIEMDSNLIIRYEIKNTHTLTVTATKEAYTYAEIESMIIVEILAYGAPLHGAVLQTQGGEDIASDATLGKGTYRMLCYLNSADGLAQGYVYLTVE